MASDDLIARLRSDSLEDCPTTDEVADALEAKDISIKTLSMLLRTNLLLRHPDRTYEEVDADIRKIVEGTDV